MGTWGIDILENDESFDIYEQYMEMYNENIIPEEIKHSLHLKYSDTLEPPLDDNTNYWFGLAMAQLETQTVDKEIIETISLIVSEEIDYDNWKAINERYYKERKEVVKIFLEKLQNQYYSQQ